MRTDAKLEAAGEPRARSQRTTSGTCSTRRTLARRNSRQSGVERDAKAALEALITARLPPPCEVASSLRTTSIAPDGRVQLKGAVLLIPCPARPVTQAERLLRSGRCRHGTNDRR